VKLTGVRKDAAIHPVERRVGCLVFVLSRSNEGLVEGPGGGPPNKSLSLVLSAWIPLWAVEGIMTKLEV